MPCPTGDDVATLLGRMIQKVVALLARRGRAEAPDGDPDDVQVQLEIAASRSLRHGGSEAPPPPPLCARSEGFSLHAGIAIHENDREGLERLARYCARPALSLERLSLGDDGRVHSRRMYAPG
jgi:putative transposase